jgi:hypothetical protein
MTVVVMAIVVPVRHAASVIVFTLAADDAKVARQLHVENPIFATGVVDLIAAIVALDLGRVGASGTTQGFEHGCPLARRNPIVAILCNRRYGDG